MVERIVKLPNVGKIEFATFLVRRYYLEGAGINGNIRDEMKLDRDSLIKISAGLKSSARRLRLIDKEMLLEVASRIDEAVRKMS